MLSHTLVVTNGKRLICGLILMYQCYIERANIHKIERVQSEGYNCNEQFKLNLFHSQLVREKRIPTYIRVKGDHEL